ncbi:cell division protein FtsA [Salmonella enterica subsp. enterica serovar Enteritidis]|nr:cell division protein FtsA [Salmonella enterica subsp. enterica serovar Enteritidis]
MPGMPDRSYQLDGSWPSDRDYGANRYLSRGCASPARAGKMKGVFQCR